MGISKNNLQNKLQQEARQVPHFGIRKLAIGTASVLLSTSLYFGAMGRLVQANANVATGNNVENEKINSGKKDRIVQQMITSNSLRRISTVVSVC